LIIGVAALLRASDQWIFELQKRSKWTQTAAGEVQIGLGCIGGSVEAGESLLAALRREAWEEIGCQIEVNEPSSASPFLVHPDFSIAELSAGDKEAPVVFFWQANKPGYVQEARVAVFSGTVRGAIQVGDLPGILCLEMRTLLQLNHRRLTVGEIMQGGARLMEKEEIPRAAVLTPVGTVEVLLALHRGMPSRLAQCGVDFS